MAKQGSYGDFTLDKALPSSIEAERLILGVILLDNVVINQAVENLKPDDLFLGSNRRIYDKMIALYERGQAIDPLTLQEELRRAGELEQVGGPAYIAALFDGVPRFSNIENYIKLVKGKSTLRRLITSANQIMAMAFDDEEEPEEILDRAESLILSIGEDRIKQGFVHIGDVATRQLTVIEESAGREQLITGIATGFADLDYMTSGLQRGDLIIIAARPSMGKCLTADSEIMLADGSVATIEEIYMRREATTLTLSDDFKFRLTRPSAFVDDGIKPVYRVTTRLGRYVDSTLSHPYLTIDGWRKLAELKVGDRIAVPRRIEIFGALQLPEDQIESLAVATRDGIIPPVVFQLAKPQLAHFLKSLFDMDAHVSVTQGRVVRIGYSTVSERLARQMQHLLLRFGVIAKLSIGALKKDEATGRQSWRLEITDAHSLWQTYSEIRVNPQPANAGASIQPGVERSGTPGKSRDLIHQPANAGASIQPGVEQSGTPGKRGDLIHQPANAGASIQPGVEQSGTPGKRGDLIHQPANAGASIQPGVEQSGTPGKRGDLIHQPANAGASIQPGVERSGTPGKSRDLIHQPANAGASIQPGVEQSGTSGKRGDLIHQPSNAGVSIQPGVERSGTPGKRGDLIHQPANAGASIQPGVERSGTPGKSRDLNHQPANAGDSLWDRSQMQMEQPIMMSCRLLRRLDADSSTPFLGFRALRSTPGYLPAPAFEGWKDADSSTPFLGFRALRSTPGYLPAPAFEGWKDADSSTPFLGFRALRSTPGYLPAPAFEGWKDADSSTPFLGFRALRSTPGYLPAPAFEGWKDADSSTPFLGFRALRSTPGYMLSPAFVGWKLEESDVYWDEIVSIEYLGNKQVYDLTIPETHNFVANDICVHNTAFSLNIAQNAATRPHRDVEKAVIGVFSLEMSNEQLVNRLLCSQARVDAHRLRTGYLSKDEWRRLAVAVGELAETKIYLDDTPGISVLEMRAKARRLKNEQKSLDLLIVDYLQLMSGRGRQESRQQEVSQISRELKMLAKELNVPLVALSQLSRAPETRTGNHKPQLSDLRESGCLAGDTLVTMADGGAQIPIRDLAGKSGFKVWALNESNFRLEPAVVSRAFATGVKPVFRLTTRLGRTIRATANHKFRAFAGWKRLDELAVGEHLALPRVIGRQPNTNRDVIPNAVWREVVVPAAQDAGLTTRQMMAGINIAYCGSSLYKHNLSRERAARVAQIVSSNALALLAQSDVYWDQIVAVEPDGEADVYDLTVPGLQSFESNGLIVHNSIEQDSDVVMFIYREEIYKPETEKQNIAEIIIGKQRNGPIGSVELVFLKQLTRFEDKYREQG